MSVGVMTVGVMSVGELTVGVMTVRVMRRPRLFVDVCKLVCTLQGRIQGGAPHPARAPLKLEKIRFFGVKS